MQKQKTDLTILIPCLNEKKTIEKAIVDIKKNIKKYLSHLNVEIIISDNGSTDGTLQILSKIKGIKIVRVPTKGYGAALHYGIMNSKGKNVLFADADLSYPFSNMKYFSKVIDSGYDLVLGSRLKGKIQDKAMPFLHRYLGTPILTFLIRLIYKIKTTDCNSGMRMVNKRFYKQLNMRNSGMEWASELLLKTAIVKGKYFEFPISYHRDKRGKSPHLSTWADGWRHLKAILLIQPKTILFVSLFTLVLSFVFYSISFGIFFLLLVLTYVFSLSYLTLKLLESIIEQKKNRISEFLLQFKIVPIVIAFTVFSVFIIYFINNEHMGTKLIISSILGITYMWVFLVETIKTHLANRLSNL